MRRAIVGVMPSSNKKYEFVGDRFGRLLVTAPAKSIGGNSRWRCLCDCGKVSVVFGMHLKHGNTTSCGCYRREFARKYKHKPTVCSWAMMMQRCYNPKYTQWLDYGGRGIKVCRRWHRYENFLADMGKRPKNKTLDRFPDNDRGYRLGNCRWATRKQQQRNRRRSLRR